MIELNHQLQPAQRRAIIGICRNPFDTVGQICTRYKLHKVTFHQAIRWQARVTNPKRYHLFQQFGYIKPDEVDEPVFFGLSEIKLIDALKQSPTASYDELGRVIGLTPQSTVNVMSNLYRAFDVETHPGLSRVLLFSVWGWFDSDGLIADAEGLSW